VEHRLDLHENTEKNLVTATFEFPGFSKDEVQLNFQNGKLTVSAETNKSEDYVDTGYTIRERLHGKFSRTLQLPQGVQVCRPNIIEYMSIDIHRFTGRTD
jgi:HSP20 family protein